MVAEDGKGVSGQRWAAIYAAVLVVLSGVVYAGSAAAGAYYASPERAVVIAGSFAASSAADYARKGDVPVAPQRPLPAPIRVAGS
jgi:hypothetical protein